MDNHGRNFNARLFRKRQTPLQKGRLIDQLLLIQTLHKPQSKVSSETAARKDTYSAFADSTAVSRLPSFLYPTPQ
jgi:hypothetical protein